jgi:FKBP12-rapamycin complex-associated protein
MFVTMILLYNCYSFCLQVRESLPWLNPRLEPSEYRRYAAVLVCRELASEAPAVFNVHVKAFLDGIWGGLRDPKLHVREASVQALEVGGR